MWGPQREKGTYSQSQHRQSPPKQPTMCFTAAPSLPNIAIKKSYVTMRIKSSTNTCHLISIVSVVTGTCKDVRIFTISIEFVEKHLFLLFQISA